MRLTSLKLAGFKSFVDPTSFAVPSQLVGVVGPNGCGKSNIMDATRWVLGESKASELRGESMQDVIFNGSGGRKPAGRASVELVFDNSAGRVGGAWGQYAELAVKRVLTRDGSSTYYINNQAVRRRDIQDIFLGTGLGPRAYAIIGQGMISRIIEARPEELRIFLEEAAGVSKYKERRRETENRLHDTRENLTRLEDILRELNANLQKLEEQAKVAQTYHTLSQEQTEKQQGLWWLRKSEAQSEQEKHQREITKTQTELEGQTANLRKIEAELDALKNAGYQATDALQAAQAAYFAANGEVSTLEAQIKFVIESKNRLQQQINTLNNSYSQWHGQSVALESEITQTEQQQIQAQEKITQLGTQQSAALEAIKPIEQQWHTAREGLAAQRTLISQKQQALELQSAHQRNAARTLQNLEQRKSRLLQEKNALVLPDAGLLQQRETALNEQKAKLEKLSAELAAAEKQQGDFDQVRRSAAQNFVNEQNKIAQLEARLNAQKNLQENLQKQAKTLPWLKKHELADLPRLIDKLSIQTGWEAALEAVLQERINALEISKLDYARAFLNDAPPAKLALFSASNTVTLPAHASLSSMSSLLQTNDPALRSLMADWLAHFYVAESVEEALQKREQLQAGEWLVVKGGHMVGRSAVRFYAADSEQAGMLARRQEIENLDKQVRAQRLLSDEAKNASLKAESEFNQAAQHLNQLRTERNAAQNAAHSQQMEWLKLSEQHQRSHGRSTQIEADLAEILTAETEETKLQTSAVQAFESLDTELAALQNNFETARTAHDAQEHGLTQAREAYRQAERTTQEAQFNLKSVVQKLEGLVRNLSTAREQARNYQSGLQTQQLELSGLTDAQAQTGLQQALETRTQREAELARARSELEALNLKMRQVDENRLREELGLQPVRDKIVQSQLKEQEARLNFDQYAQALSEASADETVLAEKFANHVKPAYLQGEVTRLANAIAALGAVNLAALDELKTASERKVFLDAQNADLVEAMTTLEDAIRKIDRETRDLLKNTFDQVNHHFGLLFPTLFGGGTAKLTMTGEEILDSGVLVQAQPPGKRNSSIALLSGGEKALTAIALVFALFQLNPAPFCLLDEVDAPLDDANTERFCKMVKQMSANTQFLFITHNKVAMEMAQQLVGVTMQEQGVSRVVAVDIETATKFDARKAA